MAETEKNKSKQREEVENIKWIVPTGLKASVDEFIALCGQLQIWWASTQGGIH